MTWRAWWAMVAVGVALIVALLVFNLLTYRQVTPPTPTPTPTEFGQLPTI